MSNLNDGSSSADQAGNGRPSAELLEKALRDVQTYVRLPFLFEHWYVAGLSSEFGRKLVAKTLLDRSIVFFRKEDGSVVALQNRCAHRSYPLSESHLEGDTIKCGYHGTRYDSTGKITNVPCQKMVPKAGVRSYPIVETGPFVWIWMGRGPADHSLLPDMRPYMSEKWSFCAGTLPMEGNYLLMQENLADLSHLPFLHATTFGVPENWAARPVIMDLDEEKLTVRFHRVNNVWAEAKPFFPPSFDFEHRPFEEKIGGHYISPAFFRGWDEFRVLSPKPDEAPVMHIFFDHFLTPATQSSTHYYYAVARDMAIEDVEYTKVVGAVMASAFSQDSVAVKAMQTLLDHDKHDFRELNIAGDKAAIASRKMIIELVRREYEVSITEAA